MRAVIFDAYGTLLSTGNGSVKVAAEILSLHNRPDIPAEKFYADWKQLHRTHIGGLKSFVNEEEIFKRDLAALYRIYNLAGNPLQDAAIMLNTLGNREAFPETREVVGRLSAHYMVAVGSVTDTKPLLQDLSRNRITVSRVFTSESIQAYKPRPEFYKRILASLGLAPGEALFVGDSLSEDIEGPQRAGMRACWINRKNGSAGQIRPDYEIVDLRELFHILDVGECG